VRSRGCGIASLGLLMFAEVAAMRYAFAVLSIGPFLGTASMLALRRAPESLALAGGRR
jgi:hypothetical protein